MRVVSHKVMVCVKTQFFKFHRSLLLLLGLWPYEQTKLVQLQIILVFSMLISCVVYQFMALVFAEYTSSDFINIFSILLYFIMFVTSYNSFRFNINDIKWLLDYLQHICNELKDKDEIAIITKYGKIANYITALFILFHIFNNTVFLCVVSLLYHIDTALNESQLHHIKQSLFPDFFVISHNQVFLLMLYFVGATFIGGIALITIMTMLLVYLKYGCGMFRIASYRIEKAMTVNMLKNINFENKIIIYKKIIHAVDIHRKAIKFCTHAVTSFQGTLLCLIGISVICLSVNLYKIAGTKNENDIIQYYIHIVLIAGLFVFLFIINYTGQEMIDCNNHVMFTAYNIRWYIAPLHVQKLILFLLQSGSKVFNPAFGGIFTFSIAFFATLTKASFTYFSVMCSMQH
ncbi:uncharacterized protein LOC120357460 [Solenopsis invicta]|uniref:uncharacterized protein LOC120357460 n=1 Tax=Solenopsis invicta TaxID=13686 RepID=UPI00193EB56B|nr:uncharacterized protein LOC120357460 [Solenopsis invicta]